MLIIKMAKIEYTDGHIGIMLMIEMAKIEINRRLYWIYFIYIDYQNENQTLLIIAMAKIENMRIIQIAKLELIGGHIGFMLIIEIAKME